MSASIQPITIYGHKGRAPNPPKVHILLDLLNIPWTLVELEMKHDPTDEKSIKHPSYLAVNPNGRIPAIVDPNQNNIAVWESAAILQYITEVYDTTHKFSGKTLEERTLINEWIAFQISGQGPIQGQIFWFSFDRFHKEKYGEAAPPHVVQRFRDEIHRVCGVVEGQLARQKAKGSDWIACDRMTIADIAWYPWSRANAFAGIDMEEFPNLKAWVDRMGEVPAVKHVYETVAGES
ncbi:Glutathione-S-transferase [Drechslerella dactyloides]|uniref:Glutathione-S-transferase n=1 Tax=Drechslerella dactyloides TaxID=74499 RepID=A0AAD6J543_DREDA|nr:Glutathione-S-transferase [Drechslerella dactyloides]